MGLTPDVDSCNGKFSYDLFSLFTYKHRNSNVETVAEKLVFFLKLHMLEKENTEIRNRRGVLVYMNSLISSMGTTFLDYLLLASLNW